MSEMALRLIGQAKEGQWKRLDLGSCGIIGSIPIEINQLHHLEELILSENYSPNSKMANSITAFPKSMSGLHSLLLIMASGCKELHDIEAIKDIKNLRQLHLSNAPIRDIDVVSTQRNLEILKLDGTFISSIDPLKHLVRLVELDLSRTEVSNFEPLAKLQSIEKLILSETPIEDLEPLRHLNSLKHLNLSDSKIRDLSPISELFRIEKLDISCTRIKNLDGISELTALSLLDLAKTKVEDLSPLRKIIATGVEVNSNNYFGIWVKECSISNPPIEIVSKGRKAILNYFSEKEIQGSIPLLETKLLIVGEGGAGKTSLLVRMFKHGQGLPNEAETTKGIDIHCHEYRLKDGQMMRLNVWDFGGQEIYHATHQFFLTKRSLYILVDDTRQNDIKAEDLRFKYWLEMIELLGGDSPIIIFQNNKGGRSKEIDRDGIKSRFRNVSAFYAGDLARPDGAMEIKKAIEDLASKMPHIGEPWPKSWHSIRKELEKFKATSPYIEISKYYSIFKKFLEFDEERANHLSQFLHDLGVVLHFQDDELLRKTIILKNDWATEAVFKILDDELIKQKKGYFTLDDCKRIWSNSTYHGKEIELRQLMLRFELCYELRDTKTPIWLAPQLLSPAKPDSIFFPESDDTFLRIEYELMPKGLVNRLMVRLNRFVQEPEKSWKNGVVFRDRGTTALVEIPFGKMQINFRVKGEDTRRFLTILTEDLESLHGSFEGLNEKVKKMIPCKCETCKSLSEAHAFDLEYLIQKKKFQKNTVECTMPPFRQVPVDQLLEGILLDKKKKKTSNVTSLKKNDEKKELKGTSMGNTSKSSVSTKGVKLFISYSSDDEKHRLTWDKQTAVLQNLDFIAPWHMRKILPGDKWDPVVRRELEEADVIVLFVSASFFASKYIWEVELKRAQERFDDEKCEVAIVIVEHCSWELTWLAKVQALNDGQVIATAPNEAEAWSKVVKDLKLIVDKVNAKKRRIV